MILAILAADGEVIDEISTYSHDDEITDFLLGLRLVL